jgi:hypothetical protein
VPAVPSRRVGSKMSMPVKGTLLLGQYGWNDPDHLRPVVLTFRRSYYFS